MTNLVVDNDAKTATLMFTIKDNAGNAYQVQIVFELTDTATLVKEPRPQGPADDQARRSPWWHCSGTPEAGSPGSHALGST